MQYRLCWQHVIWTSLMVWGVTYVTYADRHTILTGRLSLFVPFVVLLIDFYSNTSLFMNKTGKNRSWKHATIIITLCTNRPYVRLNIFNVLQIFARFFFSLRIIRF